MTNKQLHLLKILSRQDTEAAAVCRLTFEGVEEKDIEELMDKDFVRVTLGDGHMEGIEVLHLTADGHDFIKDFCETCECMPCDCDWGCL